MTTDLQTKIERIRKNARDAATDFLADPGADFRTLIPIFQKLERELQDLARPDYGYKLLDEAEVKRQIDEARSAIKQEPPTDRFTAQDDGFGVPVVRGNNGDV